MFFYIILSDHNHPPLHSLIDPYTNKMICKSEKRLVVTFEVSSLAS